MIKRRLSQLFAAAVFAVAAIALADASHPQASSLIDEHAQEVVAIQSWMIVTLGGAVVTLFAWILLSIKSRLESIDAHLSRRIDDHEARLKANEIALSTLRTTCAIYHSDAPFPSDGGNR